MNIILLARYRFYQDLSFFLDNWSTLLILWQTFHYKFNKTCPDLAEMSALWVSKSASHIKLQCCCHRRDEKNRTDLTGGKKTSKYYKHFFFTHSYNNSKFPLIKNALKRQLYHELLVCSSKSNFDMTPFS